MLTINSIGVLFPPMVVTTYLQSFRKFLVVSGQSSVKRSTTTSPLLVSSMTAMSSVGKDCYLRHQLSASLCRN